MTGWLPDDVTSLFGPEAVAEEAYDLLTVDVPADSWTEALTVARDTLGCTYFDWLSAVDEPGTGFRVCAHVAALHPVRRLLVRTTVPHSSARLASAISVYAGAGWHERETHEMFGVDFDGHPGLDPLLLPDSFEGHPLRKDFVLAARVVKAWPGAKEPGESEHGGPKRRQMLPPGVPDPNEWGPLKGQLPPAPARPARGAGRAAGARAAGGAGAGAGASAGAAAGERPVRRARSASEGSASQAATGTPRRTRSASEGSASQAGAAADAPWHNPRAAFADQEGRADTAAADTAPADTTPAADTAPEAAEPEPPATPAPEPPATPAPEPPATPAPEPPATPEPEPPATPAPDSDPEPPAGGDRA